VAQNDWVFALKGRIKRNRRLATLLFYLTDHMYLRNGPRDRFLGRFSPGARLLNLGAGFRPSPAGFLPIDRDPLPGIRVVGDTSDVPLRSGILDGILCETVLEHVPEAEKAFAELDRLLKPGGRVFLTLPFLWPYHASPHDYRRWTSSGVARDLRGFQIVDQGLTGGPTTALVNLAHEWLAITLSLGLAPLYRILYLALMPLLFPFKFLDVIVGRMPNAEKIGALFYVEAVKPASGAGATAPADGAGNPALRATR
jgi:SAM-dependent methyltransferase